MSALATPTRSRLTPSRADGAVFKAELALFRREPGSLFWIMIFPTGLFVVLGTIPVFREVGEAIPGMRLIDVYVPIAILTSLLMASVQAMPPVITGYREQGILRRMSTTPVRPATVLGAQMALHGIAALVSAALTISVGALAFDVPLPKQGLGYLLALALSVCAALSLGALLSALSRTSKAANAVGAVAFFPMMFSAGLWMPVQTMPDMLGRIMEVLPFGAASQALSAAGAGDWPSLTHLGALALWTVLLTGAAARWFRWE
ncbi:ABC transporter permease [Streptomyces sp. LHD-70]|uniref:ABC transporter permease n=1 Tax=Streptomyces sp. LHD-70 TaxID=3072140 RepID=UPI00280EA082|nr:ABC transporter permease [Streptomyces sp. LHD-70]MDQ8701993.1 ABC transporter permease [Streptomyces sp. LHD-70]